MRLSPRLWVPDVPSPSCWPCGVITMAFIMVPGEQRRGRDVWWLPMGFIPPIYSWLKGRESVFSRVESELGLAGAILKSYHK